MVIHGMVPSNCTSLKTTAIAQSVERQTLNLVAVGSSPTGGAASVAQWIARMTSNHKVAGSSPAGSF